MAYGMDRSIPWVKDTVGGLTAALVGFGLSEVFKRTHPVTGAVVAGVTGTTGVVAKSFIRPGYFHEIAESGGYSGLGVVGTWLSANTLTPGNIPMQMTSTSAAVQSREAALARARSLVSSQPMAIQQPSTNQVQQSIRTTPSFASDQEDY